MAISTRELYLILRARDEASRVLRAAGANIAAMDAQSARVAQNQIQRGMAMATVGTALVYTGVQALQFWNSATNAAIAYNQQAAYTKTQTDKVAVSLETLKNIGRDVAREIPAPFEEMQTGLYDIFSSMDVTVGGSKKLLREFARAAVAGQVDMETAGRGTIAILNAWNLEAKDVNRVNDIMFQLVRKGVGTYEEFAKAIGRAVPSASRAGQSFEQLAGMMAFLTRNGLSTSMAATSAARALDAMSHPKTVAKMEKLGITVRNAKGEFLPMVDIIGQLNEKFSKMTAPEKAKALYDLFLGSGGTIQARRFFDMALKNFGELDQRVDEMVNSAGALDEAYDIMFNAPQSKIQLLTNRYQIMKTEIGDHLIPFKMKLVEVGLKLMDMWDKLGPRGQKIVIMLGLLATALITIVGVVSVIAGLFLMFAGAAALAGTTLGAVIAPVLGVSAAIAAVGVVIGLVWKYHEQLWEWVKKVWDNFYKKIQPAVDKVKEFAGILKEAVLPVLKEAWEEIKTGAADAWEVLKDSFEDLKQAWEDIKRAFSDPEVQQTLKLLGQLILTVLVVAVVALAAAFSGLAMAVAKGLGPLLEMIAHVVAGAIRIISGLIQFITSVFTGDWQAAWHGIVNIVQGTWEIIWGIIAGAAKTIWGIVDGLTSGIATFFSWLFDVLVGHSIVPDLVNAIIMWFAKLPVQIPKIISNMAQAAIGRFASLASTLISRAASLASTLASRFSSMVSEIVSRLSTLPGRAASAVSSLPGKMSSVATSSMNRFRSAVSSGANSVVSLARGIPGRIRSAVGNLGSLLYGAGLALMSGLKEGILRGLRGVLAEASAIARKIKSVKGPREYDRRVLNENGQWLMQGLEQGLLDYLPKLLATAAGIAPKVETVIGHGPNDRGPAPVDYFGGGPGLPPSGGYGFGGTNIYQDFTINTQEIDPVKHGADLGYEIARRMG